MSDVANLDIRLKLAQIDRQLMGDRDGERQKIPLVSWRIAVTLLAGGAAQFSSGAAFMAWIVAVLK